MFLDVPLALEVGDAGVRVDAAGRGVDEMAHASLCGGGGQPLALLLFGSHALRPKTLNTEDAVGALYSLGH